MHAYPLIGREIIVIVLDNHVFELGHYSCGRKRIFRMHVNTNHYVGGKILTHNINREIIIDSAVVDIHPIHFYRLENSRETH